MGRKVALGNAKTDHQFIAMIQVGLVEDKWFLPWRFTPPWK
jgi:hypothetical protein